MNIKIGYGITYRILRLSAVWPDDPEDGRPQYIWGLKNEQPVKYYVNYDEEFGWLYEHRELGNFE